MTRPTTVGMVRATRVLPTQNVLPILGRRHTLNQDITQRVHGVKGQVIVFLRLPVVPSILVSQVELQFLRTLRVGVVNGAASLCGTSQVLAKLEALLCHPHSVPNSSERSVSPGPVFRSELFLPPLLQNTLFELLQIHLGHELFFPSSLRLNIHSLQVTMKRLQDVHHGIILHWRFLLQRHPFESLDGRLCAPQDRQSRVSVLLDLTNGDGFQLRDTRQRL
mmetsp:Transcript_9756/g.27202  ORF Transcript_9756/g.27202 Transcript_9756/m.27202 type:complete len:221 (+) Transcript_9756:488-1150(+)